MPTAPEYNNYANHAQQLPVHMHKEGGHTKTTAKIHKNLRLCSGRSKKTKRGGPKDEPPPVSLFKTIN